MKRIKRLIIVFIILGPSITAFSQGVYKKSQPLAHTYSIVARDPNTGDMAAAVQSHWFSVGSLVIWGKSGVGVVATQSFVNPAFGPEGLELMANGISATNALDQLIANDEGRAVRQVAFLDNDGNVNAHTGKLCIDFAHHIVGDNYSVQSNMMLSNQVPEAMAKAYEENEHLPLAERVVAVLAAAQLVGGDIRGRQSAALLVVSKEKGKAPWEDKLISLRVEDHPEPVKEITRLLSVHRAYAHMNKGDLAVEHDDMDLAMQEYQAAQTLFPDNQEMKFWTAVTLANNKDIDKAAGLLYAVFQGENGKNWLELLKRLPKVGLITLDEAEFRRLLEMSNKR